MANENEAYTAEYFNQYQNTISNGEARIPICFCIDTSKSMNIITNDPSEYEIEGENKILDGIKTRTVKFKEGYSARRRIDEVKHVLKKMTVRIKSDDRLCNSVVISIITFDKYADCIAEFSEVNDISEDVFNKIKIGDECTNASKGISMSLERINQFIDMNTSAGNDTYLPVFVFMSDGSVVDDPDADRFREEVKTLSDISKINAVPIAISRSADERWMKEMTSDSKVYSAERQNEFDEVFEKITRRISRSSDSLPADENIQDDEVFMISADSGTSYGKTSSQEELEEFFVCTVDETDESDKSVSSYVSDFISFLNS